MAKLGAIVKKGEVIAKMGSTGRSTGPHVHFEVYKNGRTVDPSTYIHRTIR
jgi:murein DD-endopeptidase MepM/ murein hydrolase activator NlpD